MNKTIEEKTMVEYDKFGVLRTVEEAKVVNKALGYCSKCKELVYPNGNTKVISAYQVDHRFCETLEVNNEK